MRFLPGGSDCWKCIRDGEDLGSGRPAFLSLRVEAWNGFRARCQSCCESFESPANVLGAPDGARIDADGVSGDVTASIDIKKIIKLRSSSIFPNRRSGTSSAWVAPPQFPQRIELVPGIFGRKRTGRYRVDANSLRPHSTRATSSSA